MGFDSPSHWLILAVVVVVLFGYKKLPDMSRSVGRSLRIFKTELKGMSDDDAARDGESAASEQPTPPIGPAAVQPAAAQPVAPTVTVPAGQPVAPNGATAAPVAAVPVAQVAVAAVPVAGEPVTVSKTAGETGPSQQMGV